MIKNQKQYHNTVQQVANFEKALAAWAPDKCPDGVQPAMYALQKEALAGQLDTLRNELREFDALKNGEIQTISLASLEELPQGLIKARIARGFTQKQLAERLEVKQQQIQRWEFEDYENVSFSNMVEIAHALGVGISESIRLPSNPRPAIVALKELGISKSFLQTRLVPTRIKCLNNISNDADLLTAAASRLERIFGCVVSVDGSVANDERFAQKVASARYKIPSDAIENKVAAYSVYASHLAEIVAKSVSTLPGLSISRDWRALREALCGDQPPTFETLLKGAWRHGVAVVPLSDPIRFHGFCTRIGGRNVAVLKQSARYESRWAFDLVHELYHAGETPEQSAMSVSSGKATDPDRRASDDEVAANELAGNVLLNGRAQELFETIFQSARKDIGRMKAATISVAASANVDIGCLANYVAYRLRTDHNREWWGVATNLQPESADPFEIARTVCLQHLDLSAAPDDDRDLIQQALNDPTVIS